jgi:hypothetical protein
MEEEIGKAIVDEQGKQAAEIQGPPIPSVSSVRQTQGLLSEIQYVSALP